MSKYWLKHISASNLTSRHTQIPINIRIDEIREHISIHIAKVCCDFSQLYLSKNFRIDYQKYWWKWPYQNWDRKKSSSILEVNEKEPEG